MDEKLKQEIIDLVRELQQADSIEIGNSKTGVIKVYVNFDELAPACQKIDNAISVLKSKRKEILGGEI